MTFPKAEEDDWSSHRARVRYMLSKCDLVHNSQTSIHKLSLLIQNNLPAKFKLIRVTGPHTEFQSYLNMILLSARNKY